MSRTSGRCCVSQARFFSYFVVQRHWSWRLRVSSLTVCTHSQTERRTDARRSARFFNSTFVVAFQAANTAGGKRDARKRQRRRGGKQYRHKSKQSEYIAIHEPVPRLTLIESVYHANRGWQHARSGLAVLVYVRSRRGAIIPHTTRTMIASTIAPMKPAPSPA